MSVVRSQEDVFAELSGLDVRNRPLRLRFAEMGEPVQGALFPHYCHGNASICGGIDYQIWCVADSPTLPLKRFIGRPVALDIVTDKGELNSICGLVTEAHAGDSDGGLATYRLRIQDALAVLDMNVRTRIFQHKNELDIVSAIVSEWRLSSPVISRSFQLKYLSSVATADYPQRAFIMQYNESDAAFIRRLLRRRGISWAFEPGGSDPGKTSGETTSHAMTLFTLGERFQQNKMGTVRYHLGAATEESDTIRSWSGLRSIKAGRAERFSWDYKDPAGRYQMATRSALQSEQGDVGDSLAVCLEDFQVATPHLGDNREDFVALGDLVVRRREFESKCFSGEGTVRAFRVGEYFVLEGHPEIGTHPVAEREFVITSLTLSVVSNLPVDLAKRLRPLFANSDLPGAQFGQMNDSVGGLQSHRCWCSFTAVRHGTAIVPAFDASRDVPSPPVQSAVVAGPVEDEVYCDSLGRVLVTFPGAHTESKRQPFSPELDEPYGNSAWLRVASNWAGNGPGSQSQCGTLGLPRVGTEVLVSFLNGDPDKPIIIGQLFNNRAEPPALSKQGALPGNRYLSGIKSREIRGRRGNQLRLDDSPGRINAQLASDHGTSELNLGFLVHPLVNGHGEMRGQGAELRSDQSVALRGGQGALISAAPSEHARGNQLDCAELKDLLKDLRELTDHLAEVAETQSGDPSSGKGFSDLIRRLSEMTNGGQSIIAVSAPHGLVSGTGGSAALSAKNDFDTISGGNLSLAAGDNVFVRALSAVSVFANKLGIRLIAGKGQVKVAANEDSVEVVAKRVLQLISNTDWINIKARQGVRIYGGGSELEISASGIKGFTVGVHQIHASRHEMHPKQQRQTQFPGEVPNHEICIPCLLLAAQAHSPLVEVK